MISYVWLPNEPLADANFIRCVDLDVIYIFPFKSVHEQRIWVVDFQPRNKDGEPSWFNMRFCSLGNNSRNLDHYPFFSKSFGISHWGVPLGLCFWWRLPKLGAKGPPRRRLQFGQQPKKANKTQKVDNQFVIFFFFWKIVLTFIKNVTIL